MRKIATQLLVTAMCVMAFGAAHADNTVTINGEVRSRTEMDKKSFEEDAHTKSFTVLRTRVGVAAEANENASVFVQFQDSRTLGGDGQSGGLSHIDNIDVHQAFLRIGELWKNGPGLKAGRFELNLGNQRVFGAVGWHNVGRAWEGMLATLKRQKVKVDAFWLKRMELNSTASNMDFDIVGANVKLSEAGAEFFFVYETDARSVALSQNAMLDRINLGAHLNRKFGQVQVIGNGVIQIGEREIYFLNAPVSQDISAFLLTAEAIIDLDSRSKPQFAAGFDFASGDDNPFDDDYTAYDNLYYTGHKFRGHMDYFLDSESYGLLDLLARGSISPAPGWRVGLNAHLFQTVEDYKGINGEDTKSVGTEFDFHASTSKVPGAKIKSGISIFLPSEDFAGADSKTGLWGYLMVTVGFGQKK